MSWLNDMKKDWQSDASFLSLRGILLTNGGYTILGASFFVEPLTGISFTAKQALVFTSVCMVIAIGIILMGEYSLRRSRDEFLRRIHEQALALASLTSLVLGSGFFYIGRLYMDPIQCAEIAWMLIWICFAVVREGYQLIKIGHAS